MNKKGTPSECEHDAYILSMDEKYWSKLCQRSSTNFTTHIFVRKNHVAPKQVNQLFFYVTKKKQILGTADFLERITGNSEELWKKYGNEGCFETYDEYKAFLNGRRIATFIRFNNFVEVANPKPKDELIEILGSIDRFGIGRYLDRETALLLV